MQQELYMCLCVVQLQVMQQEPVTVKGLDMEKFFKSELRQAIKDLNDMYEERLEAMSTDLEAKYAAQVGVFVTFCCAVGWDGVGWCKMVWGGVRCGVVWGGVRWCGVVWGGVRWCGVV